MASTYVTKMYDRFDRICYDHYGDTDNKIVAIVMQANPDVVDQHGIILPPGITINLPDRAAIKNDVKVIQMIQLWS
jgi:phage tail protein X